MCLCNQGFRYGFGKQNTSPKRGSQYFSKVRDPHVYYSAEFILTPGHFNSHLPWLLPFILKTKCQQHAGIAG